MKNIRSALFGVLAAFAAHAAASFVTVLIVADPAAADEKDPAFVGFLALAVFFVSSVLASAAAHFLTRYRIADAYRRSDSAEEDKRLRRTSFLAAAGPGEAFHALVSFFLPGAVSLFFNPGGGYLAEAILTEGRVLAWRAPHFLCALRLWVYKQAESRRISASRELFPLRERETG